MIYIQQLFNNTVLVAGVLGWLTAQVLKAIIYTIVNKSFDFSRLVGDGGMPSGHSATVAAMATAAGMTFGLDSYQFAITAMLAIIVMHDAMGVRQETGKQTKVIKEMAAFIETMGKDISDEEKLKEFVGHTPFQVAVGGALGILLGVLISI
ncbi:MAG: divergent PAP2 family protein [Acetatifactor sp.]|nr:divergent PAP2 family protein [Acetatifactor sp.]